MRNAVLLLITLLTATPGLAENLALRRPYTLSHPPNYPFCTDPGDATDLTDGIRYDPRGTSLWTQKTSVGWALGEQFKQIEIDLGQLCRISAVTIETAADARSQGTFPLSVMVFLSDDGKSYNFAGELINEAINQNRYVVHTFQLTGLKEQGRYVRLQTIRGGFYVFCDEIEVQGTRAAGLRPQTRPLNVAATLALAKQRVSVLRQNNSSLSLLAEAHARLTAEQDAHPAATQAARAGLAQLKQAILARTQAHPIDFYKGIPFTPLDQRTGEVVGAFLAATGRDPLEMEAVNPWADHLPFDGKPSPPAIRVPHLLAGEWAEMAFNVTNATAQQRAVSVAVTGLPDGIIRLQEVIFVEAFGFRIRADALLPLKGMLDLPAGISKQIWLSIDTRSLAPGTYTGTLQLSDGRLLERQPFSFVVTPLKMPAQASLDINVFSYLHLNLGVADPAGMARDLAEHYVNNQTVISPYLPQPRVNAAGDSIGPMDFSKMDAYMDRLPQTRRWTLWTGFEWDHRQMVPIAGQPRRQKVFAHWLKEVIQHMKQKGYGYDQFAFLWIDEPNQENMRKIVKPASDVLREVDPRAQVWLDISSDNTETSLAAYENAVDIWCPTSEKLGWDFWQGKQTWHYDSASDKSRSPAGHYRIKAWKSLAYGTTGNAFWTYTDNAHLWDDYAGNPSYSVVYDGPDGVVSSKRWDAYRAGVEDHELGQLLKATLARARSAGTADTSQVKAAQRTLDSWVERILATPYDPALAEHAHQALLQQLLKLRPKR